MVMKLTNLSKILIILYFINLFLYSISSLIGIEELKIFSWAIRIPILIILYFITSRKIQILYVVALLLYQLATVYFYLDTPSGFIFATLCSVSFKICLVILILDLVTKKNRLTFAIASIPFFVFYLYIIEIVISSLGEVYFIWIINAFLTSFIGGVGIINYLNNSDKKSFWLLISGVLFVVQIGAFFVNKFYIKTESIYQIVILSFAISHFTFYKFLILKEEEKYVN